MRSVYFIITTIMVIITIILSIPSVALLATIFTFGMALLVMPKILITTIVLVCFLPVVMAWPYKPALLPALAVSIGLLFLIFYVPNSSSQSRAEQILADAPQSPGHPIQGPLPRNVEIIRTRSPNADLRDPVIGRDLCDNTCQSLLLGGAIDWVRIRLTDDAFGNDEANTTARFSMATGSDCRALYAHLTDNDPCIVFRDDITEAADLVIEVQENQWKNSWGEGSYGGVTPAGKRVVIARLGPDKDSPIAFLRTQLFYRIPSRHITFNIGSLNNGDGGGGFMYVPIKGKGPAIHVTEELKAIGIPLGDPYVRTKPREDQKSWEVPPDPWQSVMAASLFETSPLGDDYRHKWANAKTSHINNWLFMARAFDTLSASDLRILCLAKTDERMNHISWLDQIERIHGSLNCP